MYLGFPPPASEGAVEAAAADAAPSYDAAETHAYGLSRLPAGYAVAHRVLDEVKARCPGFEPRKVLDFGSGPGTAVWAAQEVRLLRRI